MLTILNSYYNTMQTKSLANRKNIPFGRTMTCRNFNELAQIISNKNISTILVDWNISNLEVNQIVQRWYSKPKDSEGRIISKTGGVGFLRSFMLVI